MDPSVYTASGQVRAPAAEPAARSTRPVVKTPKAVASPALRMPPGGRWSDDGIWYGEGAATSGVPGIRFPLTGTRKGYNPLDVDVDRDGVRIRRK